jgi:hypothetical protein
MTIVSRPHSPGISDTARRLRGEALGRGDRRVAYIAHPVSGDVEENLARARRWFQWLWYRYPDLALCLPYLAPCEIFEPDDEAATRRGVQDDLAILARSDVIILVGGHLSPGMAELALAQRLGLSVLDHTSLGEEPPEGEL